MTTFRKIFLQFSEAGLRRAIAAYDRGELCLTGEIGTPTENGGPMVWDTFSSLEEWKDSADDFTTPYDALQEKASYELNPDSIESLDPDSDYGLFVDYEDALHSTPDEMIVEELKLALDDKCNS